MSNAKYYFHKQSISNPEDFSSFSNFRKSLGYLWDSSTALYGTEGLVDFIRVRGRRPTGTSVAIPEGWVGSGEYVSDGEFTITMPNVDVHDGRTTDEGGMSHPQKTYTFEVE